MPRIYVARRKERKGLYLPMLGTKDKPSLMFMLEGDMSNNRLEDYVRKELEKQGITDEPTVQKIMAEAEKQYERNIKITETQKELKRLMEIKARGGTLMQVGHRKWKQAFYPSVSKGA